MSALGIQYVRPDGSDSNNGETWVKAKQTIEAAQGDLPNAWPTKGGTIYLSAGRHIANELDLTVGGTTIVGAGRGATTVVPQGLYGLEVQASWVTLQNLQITVHAGKGDDSFYGQAIRVVSDRNTILHDIWFHQLSKDHVGTDDVDVAPAAIWVGGVTNFSDWHQFTGISVWGCYRGIVNAGSANFMVSNSDIDTTKEGLYVVRRDISTLENEAGGTVQATNVWFTGGEDYLVRLVADQAAPNQSAATSLQSCILEPRGQANVDSGHIWCGLDDTRIVGCNFNGGSHSTDPTPHAVFFDDQATRCVVTGYTRSGSGYGVPDFYGNTAAQTTLDV